MKELINFEEMRGNISTKKEHKKCENCKYIEIEVVNPERYDYFRRISCKLHEFGTTKESKCNNFKMCEKVHKKLWLKEREKYEEEFKKEIGYERID